MEQFITKVEKLFEKDMVKIKEFEGLIEEWGGIISTMCYAQKDQRKVFKKLNHVLLTINWYREQYSPLKSKQFQSFLEYLAQYIRIELESLSILPEIKEEGQEFKPTQSDKINWTNHKRSLIELISALHKANCVNDGKITLQRLVEHFETCFNINLKNYHTELNKMKLRKPMYNSSQRAYFLKGLSEKFNEECTV